MCVGLPGHTVSPMLRQRGVGLFKLPIALLAAVAGAGLLVASPALGADSVAHPASAKAKRSKACQKTRKKRAACRKRKGRRASLPAIPRTVTLTWDSSADIDLQVYDSEGRHSGLGDGAIVNAIPGASHSVNDTDGFGPESFDDPSGRKVGYLACYVSGPQANVTLVDSGTGGGRYTATLGPAGSPPDLSHAYANGIGWGFLPIGARC
jgi:hypothetical protein